MSVNVSKILKYYRCGYTISNKSKIINHFNRKNSCKPKLININLDECKQYILDGSSYEEYLETIKSQQKVNINVNFVIKYWLINNHIINIYKRVMKKKKMKK